MKLKTKKDTPDDNFETINEEMKRVIGLILILVKPDLKDKTVANLFQRALVVYQKANNIQAVEKELMNLEDSPTEPNTIAIKMPTYYIAKHSDEDLQAAILADRESCAKLVEEVGKQTAAAIRAGGEK